MPLPGSWDRHSFGERTCQGRGWSRDHKSIRGQRSRSQQAPVNQTSKSKSPGRGKKGGLGSLAVRGVGPCGPAPVQGPVTSS